MKIYNLSDIHLMTRRNIKKLDDIIMERIRIFLENDVENDSIVTIAGDLFDIPIINSGKNYNCLNKLIKLMNTIHDSKNVVFMVIKGNHDYFYDAENDTSIGMMNILESMCNTNNQYCVQNISELPAVIITDSITNITLIDENIFICLLPYGSDYDQFIKRADQKNKILICHGCIENDFNNDNDEVIIPKNITDKFDYIFKGHIHKKSIMENIMSNGAVVKINSDDHTGYGFLDTENQIFVINDFKDGLDIKYVSGIYDNSNINDILESLDENTIASIYYKGSPNDINSDLFNKCFNGCLDFKIIFESNFTNKIMEVDSDKADFMPLWKYLEDNLDKDTFDYIKSIQEENVS